MPRTLDSSTFWVALVAVALLPSCCPRERPPPAAEERHAIASRVQALLDAYASNDQTRVLGLVDAEEFAFYGSDVSEVVRTPADLRRLMDDDFALWRSAKFGSPSELDIRVEDSLATAFFDVPFSAGGRPPIQVRISTTWRKRNGQWLLTQCANTVPTVGSTARDLLKQGEQRR